MVALGLRVPFLAVSTFVIVGAGGACRSEGPLVQAREEPLLYLVLNQPADIGTGISGLQRALLVSTGSPAQSVYLTADRFEMMRTSDGALYRWVRNAKQGTIKARGLDLADANYELPPASFGGSLGGRDITHGERYELAIDTDGWSIHGAVLVPDTFSVQVDLTDSGYVASWPRVRGAAQFAVQAPGLTGGLVPGFRYQQDTVAVIRDRPPGGGTVIVQALDSNLTAFLTVDTLIRSGISVGNGVFGAMSVASKAFPGESTRR